MCTCVHGPLTTCEFLYFPRLLLLQVYLIALSIFTVPSHFSHFSGFAVWTLLFLALIQSRPYYLLRYGYPGAEASFGKDRAQLAQVLPQLWCWWYHRYVKYISWRWNIILIISLACGRCLLSRMSLDMSIQWIDLSQDLPIRPSHLSIS